MDTDVHHLLLYVKKRCSNTPKSSLCVFYIVSVGPNPMKRGGAKERKKQKDIEKEKKERERERESETKRERKRGSNGMSYGRQSKKIVRSRERESERGRLKP